MNQRANEILIEMYNKEIVELKAQYPTINTFGPLHENTSDEIELKCEYETKHHEIYNRYNILWAAIR